MPILNKRYRAGISKWEDTDRQIAERRARMRAKRRAEEAKAQQRPLSLPTDWPLRKEVVNLITFEEAQKKAQAMFEQFGSKTDFNKKLTIMATFYKDKTICNANVTYGSYVEPFYGFVRLEGQKKVLDSCNLQNQGYIGVGSMWASFR